MKRSIAVHNASHFMPVYGSVFQIDDCKNQITEISLLFSVPFYDCVAYLSFTVQEIIYLLDRRGFKGNIMAM